MLKRLNVGQVYVTRASRAESLTTQVTSNTIHSLHNNITTFTIDCIDHIWLFQNFNQLDLSNLHFMVFV